MLFDESYVSTLNVYDILSEVGFTSPFNIILNIVPVEPGTQADDEIASVIVTLPVAESTVIADVEIEYI
jgi:hypothetical protein